MTENAAKLKLATLTMGLEADVSKLPKASTAVSNFVREVNSNTKKAEQSFYSIGKKAQLASKSIVSCNNTLLLSFQKVSENVARIFTNLGNEIKKFTSTYSQLNYLIFGMSVQKIVKMSDSYKMLGVRIKNVTRDTKDFSSVFSRILKLTRQTGTSLNSNVKLFEVLGLMRDELSITNKEIMVFIKAISQLNQFSGNSPQSMDSLVLQLTHGLAGGKLNMIELNSMLSNSIVLVRHLAEGLGYGTVNALKEAVHTGRVLSKDVFVGILNQAHKIDYEASTIPKNLSASLNSMKVGAIELFGELNNILYVTKLISHVMVGIGALSSKLGQGIKTWRDSFSTLLPPDYLNNMNDAVLRPSGKDTTRHYDAINRQKQSNEILRRDKETRMNLEKTQVNATLKTQEEKHLQDLQKLQVASGLFSVELTKKVGKMTLEEQAKIFKTQIDNASLHNREMFRIQKAFNLANAVMDGQRAITAAYSSGMSLGGNPIIASIFAGIAASAAAINVNAIASTSYNGNRALGGNVMAGGLYRVNENKPELLSMGNKQYLMMGSQSGEVSTQNNAKDIVVNVYSNNNVDVKKHETTEQLNLDIIIEDVEKAMSQRIMTGNSRLGEAFQNQYGLNRVAGML